MSPINPVALISTVLSSLSVTLAPVGGAVAAIIVLTLLVRLALHPLTRAAVRGERARARLAPQAAELRARYGSDLARLSRETQALYRAERISPWAGLLPTLVQLPVVFVLYRAFVHGSGALAGARLLGVPLQAHVLAAATSATGAWVFAGLLAALAALAWATSRRAAMLARAAANAGPNGGAAASGRAGAIGRNTAPGGRSESTRAVTRSGGAAGGRTAASARATTSVSAAESTQTAAPATPVESAVAGGVLVAIGRIAPYLLLVSGLVLPLAAGIYLVTTTAWSYAENALLRRGLP